MNTISTYNANGNTAVAPQSRTVAPKPTGGHGAWYYGQVSTELSELRTKLRNRQLARNSSFLKP